MRGAADSAAGPGCRVRKCNPGNGDSLSIVWSMLAESVALDLFYPFRLVVRLVLTDAAAESSAAAPESTALLSLRRTLPCLLRWK